jgi:hypothetical protein
MPALIFGILVLVLGLWALNVISKVDPKVGARVTKAGGGLLAIAAAAFLGLRGEIGLAVPLGAFGLGLLGWLPFGPAGFVSRTKRQTGQVSRVRTAFLDMELDHDSGKMRGRVTAGAHQGAMLAQLDLTTLSGLLHEIDEESRALLMAYLDRRYPRWREHAQADADAGRAAASGGKMSEKEAYQILGLETGASKEAITRAHRTLMKKFHPDQGGTSYLAARINEAKEVLFRRHR